MDGIVGVKTNMQLCLRIALHLILTALSITPALANESTHLRLVDPLDRPQDGYCIDVVGTPGYLRTDLPLFAHNCKRGLTIDSAVVFEQNGFIRFAELDLCMTVAGINSVALPGSAVVLHQCGIDSAFFETTALQTFTLKDDGRLMLSQSNLCLAVGPLSATTYSATDKWRPLFVANCSDVNHAFSRWMFTLAQ